MNMENINLSYNDVSMSTLDIDQLDTRALEALQALKKGFENDVNIMVLVCRNKGKATNLSLLERNLSAVIAGDKENHNMVESHQNQHSEKSLSSLNEMGRFHSKLSSLTPREKQILRMIGEGKRNRDIAQSLCRSLKTIETHRLNLMRKLDAHNAVELVHWCQRLPLLINS